MNTKDADDVPARGPRYLEALSSMPEQLQPIYKAMVEEYKFHALAHYGRAWVAYDVIADLVRSGWRPETNLPAKPGRPMERAQPTENPEGCKSKVAKG